MNKLDLSKYCHKERTKSEINDTIKIYNELSAKMEYHTSNDGTQIVLAALLGTIKVFYINHLYNIPVCVYLTEEHPYQAPIVYVRPTNTMRLRVNDKIDIHGRVYLKYLSEWNANSSDLEGLISILQIEFSEQMPVFSKTTPPSAYQYPSGGYPQYPVQNTQEIGSSWYNPSSAIYPVMTPTSYTAGVINTIPYNTAQFYPNAAVPGNNIYSANQYANNSDSLRMSVFSAVEEKIHRVHKDLFAISTAELEVMEKTNKDLKRGSDMIKRMIGDMEQEKTIIQRAKQELKEENEALKITLSTCEDESTVGINYDNMVEGCAPLYRQLIHLYVEEQSLEDVFFFLGVAMGKGVIDIETFLKKVRELSRKQFVLRATIQKCRDKAGLPEV